MKKIALIGCTGSIGMQVADVVRRHPDEFCFSALVAGSNGQLLSALEKEFSPRIAYCACGRPSGVAEGVFDGCDVVFIAAGGFSGLAYTLAAVEAKKTVALANKESLVCGGELVMRRARETGAEIVPVDSEHSALFQALSFRRDAPFRRLILTASGGPFLRFTEEELRSVTAEQALLHPTWRMGKKVTVDSATLLNKGYEVIEAHHLYDAPFEKIGAVVHPESIVHSLVEFEDGAMLAQLGCPDMRLPIQLALTYPRREKIADYLDLAAVGTLHFERLPEEKFPCYGLALEAGRAGGTAPARLNGGAEVAVEAFLRGELSFCGIADAIKAALDTETEEGSDFEAITGADRRGRAAAGRWIYGK